ncbi:Hypothetical protein NCS54_00915200 [Fusarium falciforme]|uniref:Hypothetical protein n=1 Tax=Fusarium falciforme TaxID=195108 RepID=UPI00230020F5|nr:Hypothetical protein NCS54_00915200 [Fusarium falciforme]WAO91672.1 Hypothetical protein NCS54_00915200 [Fusarium falciforme]
MISADPSTLLPFGPSSAKPERLKDEDGGDMKVAEYIVSSPAAVSKLHHSRRDFHFILTIPSRHGKAIAQAGMTQIFATPGLINNVTRVISDLDYVALHVHRTQLNTTDKAIADIFRLNGTCITEHWDVQQTMVPSFTNPLAYF